MARRFRRGVRSRRIRGKRIRKYSGSRGGIRL
jgi:hypothetical protein